jgi:copper chaperone CopZ
MVYKIMTTIKLNIEGMHCQSCVNRVKRALEQVQDSNVKEVSIGAASIETTDVDAAIAAVTKAGYPATRA